MRYLLLPTALLFLMLTFLTVGCGENDSSNPSAGGWTVEEEALALEEDLFISDSEAFYFGQIGDVAVAEDDRIYVVDSEESHVKMFSPEGELVETIGSQGEGPGEFARPQKVALGRGDSLYVLDTFSRYVSVFSPNHDFEYGFRPSPARGETKSVTMPEDMLVPEEGDLLALISVPIRNLDDPESGPMVLREVGSDGTPGDTVLTGSPAELVFAQERPAARRVPFGRTSAFALGPEGRIYHGWTDSLHVTIYSRTGEEVDEVSLPFEPVAVTGEDREQILGDMSERIRENVRDHIPETKPAFQTFLVDDQQRLWFKRPTEDFDRADWWVVDPEEERVQTVSLPSEVDLMVVRGGYAYGRTKSEEGAPALVRYRIAES